MKKAHQYKKPFGSQEKRLLWATTRSVLETDQFKHKRHGKKSKSHWSYFKRILNFLVWGAKISGYYKKGYENARNIEINHYKLKFSNLPSNFDGFRILHLTDLHIDSTPELLHSILHVVDQVDFDLAVLTGDYRSESSGSFIQILKPIEELAKLLQKEFPPLAILGNHDTWLMTQYEEDLKISFLVNETIELERDGQKILVSGADDPFSYYTDTTLQTFSDKPGFKLALVHTSELADIAADHNYNLYLCGHTHGGQVCLPGGKALISHQKEGDEFIKGFWKMGKMQGFTSKGCGVSGVPLRFNCPGEITVFTLRKSL
ncbi:MULTISPECIES: metallophosphoesterase [unclassified Lentimicrobium]|uniref:metallophosphoesterase n=1 Tax=unclassified Lentimicrobium TaxID=2677434 RepID=UPI001557EA70|nr:MULTISPECIES: metallophosphoesterase [unclassified Lentimicrobium]NPD45598.1 metallophosphoesterase [Lentimicrobium sp. S6]NPD86317.1 metallophosphoesterase [Lentimicrobium sp. L6]